MQARCTYANKDDSTEDFGTLASYGTGRAGGKHDRPGNRGTGSSRSRTNTCQRLP